MNTWINKNMATKTDLENEINFSDEISSYIKGPKYEVFFWVFLDSSEAYLEESRRCSTDVRLGSYSTR